MLSKRCDPMSQDCSYPFILTSQPTVDEMKFLMTFTNYYMSWKCIMHLKYPNVLIRLIKRSTISVTMRDRTSRDKGNKYCVNSCYQLSSQTDSGKGRFQIIYQLSVFVLGLSYHCLYDLVKLFFHNSSFHIDFQLSLQCIYKFIF